MMKPKEAPVPKKRGRGRPAGTEKIAVTIMLPVTTKERMDDIAETTGTNRGELVDQALQRYFAQSAPPNFAKRFARPPKGPHVGDQLVELLLTEREQS